MFLQQFSPEELNLIEGAIGLPTQSTISVPSINIPFVTKVEPSTQPIQTNLENIMPPITEYYKFKYIENGLYLSIPSTENIRWIGLSKVGDDFEFLDSDLSNTRIKHIPTGKLLIAGSNIIGNSNDGLPAWVIGIANNVYINGSDRWNVTDKNIKSLFTGGFINKPGGFIRTHDHNFQTFKPQIDNSIKRIEFETENINTIKIHTAIYKLQTIVNKLTTEFNSLNGLEIKYGNLSKLLTDLTTNMNSISFDNTVKEHTRYHGQDDDCKRYGDNWVFKSEGWYNLAYKKIVCINTGGFNTAKNNINTIVQKITEFQMIYENISKIVSTMTTDFNTFNKIYKDFTINIKNWINNKVTDIETMYNSKINLYKTQLNQKEIEYTKKHNELIANYNKEATIYQNKIELEQLELNTKISILENNISTIEAEREQYKKDVIIIQEQKQFMTDEINNYNITILESEQKYQAKNNELNELEEEYNSKIEGLKSLHKKAMDDMDIYLNKIKKETIDAIAAEKKTLEEYKDLAEKQSQQLNDRIDELFNNLAKAQTEYQDQVTKMKQKIDALQVEYENDIAKNEKNRNIYMDKLLNEFDNYANEFSIKHKEIDGLLDEKRKEFDDFIKSLEEEKIKILDEKYIEKITRLNTINLELDTTITEIKNNKNKYNQIENELVSINNLIRKAKEDREKIYDSISTEHALKLIELENIYKLKKNQVDGELNEYRKEQVNNVKYELLQINNDIIKAKDVINIYTDKRNTVETEYKKYIKKLNDELKFETNSVLSKYDNLVKQYINDGKFAKEQEYIALQKSYDDLMKITQSNTIKYLSIGVGALLTYIIYKYASDK